MTKSPDAFRTISEVAEWLGVQAHVLRFWESKFTQIKPVKRAGGRRYYRPADMKLIGGIKVLLHDDGLTIKGVQKLLREQGVAHVAEFSKPLDGFDDDTALPAPPSRIERAQPEFDLGAHDHHAAPPEDDHEDDTAPALALSDVESFVTPPRPETPAPTAAQDDLRELTYDPEPSAAPAITPEPEPEPEPAPVPEAPAAEPEEAAESEASDVMPVFHHQRTESPAAPPRPRVVDAPDPAPDIATSPGVLSRLPHNLSFDTAEHARDLGLALADLRRIHATRTKDASAS
ncbi:MAG: MerR family transcriptional regulator [Marinibacterium sp.]|nr:MerR family transcriptional regulator [Marinibacterium sp.]